MGERGDDADEDFLLAMYATTRLVKQCEAHTRKAVARLNDRVNAAARSSPCGVDRARAERGLHRTALDRRIKDLEDASNTLAMHQLALVQLLSGTVFLPLPVISITRSVAEISAFLSWLLHPGISRQQRDARAYASLFRSVENAITHTRLADSFRFVELRKNLIEQMAKQKVHVTYARDDSGAFTDRVAQVRVNNASEKIGFKYSHRIAKEIPLIAGTYSNMSAMVHGESMQIAAAYDTPATYARLIGAVVLRSTEAWSAAVHDWVGVTPAPFTYPGDWDNLVASIPAALREQFDLERSQASIAP